LYKTNMNDYFFKPYSNIRETNTDSNSDEVRLNANNDVAEAQNSPNNELVEVTKVETIYFHLISHDIF